MEVFGALGEFISCLAVC